MCTYVYTGVVIVQWDSAVDRHISMLFKEKLFGCSVAVYNFCQQKYSLLLLPFLPPCCFCRRNREARVPICLIHAMWNTAKITQWHINRYRGSKYAVVKPCTCCKGPHAANFAKTLVFTSAKIRLINAHQFNPALGKCFLSLSPLPCPYSTLYLCTQLM